MKRIDKFLDARSPRAACSACGWTEWDLQYLAMRCEPTCAVHKCWPCTCGTYQTKVIRPACIQVRCRRCTYLMGQFAALNEDGN